MPPEPMPQDAGGTSHDARPASTRDHGAKTPIAAQRGRQASPPVEDAVLDDVARFDDFDIQVLYEILQVAQSKPQATSRPYQALFPAHEAVLAQHGLDGTGPEGGYLRFLYRLPPLRRGNQGLVEVFEQVLVRQGIVIEEASDEGSGGENTDIKRTERTESDESHQGGILSRQEKSSTSRPAHRRGMDGRIQHRTTEIVAERTSPDRQDDHQDDTDLHERTRRSSFSEFLAEERKLLARVRAASRTSVSRLQDHSMGFGAKMPRPRSRSERITKDHQGDERRPRDEDLPHLQGREHREQAAATSTHEESPKRRRPSRSRAERGDPGESQSAPKEAYIGDERRRLHPERQGTQQAEPERSTSPAAITPGVSRGLNRETRQRLERWAHSVPHQNAGHDDSPQAPQEPAETRERPMETDRRQEEEDDEQVLELPRPSKAQLERDARTFNRFRMQDLIRILLQKWQAAAKSQQSRQQDGNRLAAQLARQALTKQAFRRWRLVTTLKKHLRDLERFYGVLEERAIKARNFRLLVKAFTHWAEHGAEERQRTEAARRHILRLKYFHAWQEITTANQLKVQRFVLQKFFVKWKQGFVKTWMQDNRAVALHRGKVVQDAYWSWFWRFCGDRAPQWRDGVLRRRYLSRWTYALQQKQEAAAQVVISRKQALLTKQLETWRSKTALAKRQEMDAARFQITHTISRALPPWQLQLRLAPAARRTREMVNRRITSQALRNWFTKVTMSQQAMRIDKWRVMHNAWTQWNDSLRIRLLQKQHEERLVASTLYKWVLAERAAHFQRAYETQTTARTFGGAIKRCRSKQASLQEAHDQFLASRNRKLLQGVLSTWKQQQQERKGQAQQACAFYTPRITHRLLDSWCASYNHKLELSDQASSAQRYFRTSHSLRTWHSAATASRKQKLQAAYMAVRVRHKKNQAHKILEIWWARTSHVVSLVDDAESMLHQRLWGLARSALLVWVQALQNVREADLTAAHQRQQRVLQLTLQPWALHASVLTAQVAQADAFARFGAEKLAYECIRRLQLRLLEKRNLDAKARTVRSWTDKRRARRLLRGWAETARVKGEPISTSRTGTDPAESLRSSRRSVQRIGLFSQPTMDSDVLASQPRRSDENPLLLQALSTQRQEQPLAPQLSPLPGYLSTPSKRAARARALVANAPTFTPRTEPRMRLLRSVLEAGGEGEDENAGAAPRTSFARGIAARFGQASITGDVERSMIPTAARAQLEAPLARPLFRRTMSAESGQAELGRSVRGEGVEQDE